MEISAIIEAMRRPQFYPHQPRAVAMEQTHISCVFLADDHVYKVKKPVRFSFLDFSTPEQRRRLCHEEVRLNRRLAPDTYLEVVGIREDNGRLRLCDEADAAEYAVHMRRLPRERMLDGLLEQGAVTPEMIEAIATLLARFHGTAASGPEITANGSSAAILRILEDNYSNGRRFRGITLDADDDDAIQKFARAFLQTHEQAFRRRQEQGRIRDCHGDLHTEHICLSTPPAIFDCIEFNTQFRYIDVASDIAFLAMDLDFHDRHDLSNLLVDRWIETTRDHEARALLAFYQCYRAYVRGKVDSLKSIESDVPPQEQAAARDSARRHFDLAYRYTWSDTPALVVVCGLSGTGKSTIAAKLAARLGFAHHNSDITRKQLAGLPPTFRARGDYDGGIYTAEHSERTYQQLFALAQQDLAAGRGVILDATFQLQRGHEQARALAAQHGVPVLFVECTATEAEIERRIRGRDVRNDTASDADWNVYLKQRERYEGFAEGAEDERVVLDTSNPTAPCERRIEDILRGRASLIRRSQAEA